MLQTQIKYDKELFHHGYSMFTVCNQNDEPKSQFLKFALPDTNVWVGFQHVLAATKDLNICFLFQFCS